MATAKVFRFGDNQAVRLPRQYRLSGEEVEIFRRGDEIVLREKRGTMARAFELLASLGENVPVNQRNLPQKRKGLK
jgi:antitoxin VapB